MLEKQESANCNGSGVACFEEAFGKAFLVAIRQGH